MRIGIYGGTFNPIHNAHLHILAEFHQRLELSKLVLIPTCLPPHKAAVSLAPGEDRLAMCRLAAEDLPFSVEVSDIEIRRSERSYTVETLRQLRLLYPKDTFYLLMGEDMFLTVEQWFEAEEIFSQAVICASPRSANGLERMEAHGEALSQKYQVFRFYLADIPFLNISSTQVRAGNSAEVPPRVWTYMQTHQLYQEATR